ncbi:MAG: hypothetical protein NVS1B11_19170 [Terriglobales bacterium]
MKKMYPELEVAVVAGLQHQLDSAFGHFLRGCLFGRAGNNAGSEKNLQEALRLDPNMWQAHLHLCIW